MSEASDWLRAREAFGEAGERARAVLVDPAVERGWKCPSICAGLTVGGLAGHMLGVVRTFEQRCDLPRPTTAVEVDPAEGYHVVRLECADDLEHPPFCVVRDNVERVAERGRDSIVHAYTATLTCLGARLVDETPDRLVGTAEAPTTPTTTPKTTTLRDYMTTRIVELVVHAADLAESVDVAVAPPSDAATEIVIDFLVRAVRYRLGDAEMLRAFAGRRPADSLRAL